MKCPNCGHPKENHHSGSLGMGCYFVIEGQVYAHDDCAMSPDKIEIHHWKTRLTLARELISDLTHNGLMSPNMMTDETRGRWERWQAEEQTE